MDEKTVKKKVEVIDMMISAYSFLRDKYKAYSFYSDIFQLGISVLLCATVFFDPQILIKLKISPDSVQLVLGLCSILTFLISLITLRASWSQYSEKYGQAAETLGKLKIDILSLSQFSIEHNEEKISEKFNDYSWITNNIYKIPEKMFLKLKAKHLRKIELSKMLSKNPGSNLMVLRIRLFFKSFKVNYSYEIGDDKNGNVQG